LGFEAPDLTKISQRLLPFNTFPKMATGRHLELLRRQIFEQLIGLKDPFSIVEPYYMEIGQTVGGIATFSNFQYDGLRHLGFPENSKF